MTRIIAILALLLASCAAVGPTCSGVPLGDAPECPEGLVARCDPPECDGAGQALNWRPVCIDEEIRCSSGTPVCLEPGEDPCLLEVLGG